MEEEHKHRVTVRIPYLINQIHEEQKVKLTHRVMTTVLKRLIGAEWSKILIAKEGFDRNTNEAKEIRFKYLCLSAVAKKQEDRGEAIRVHHDESYIHAGHHSGFSWQTQDCKMAAKSKGRMLIILHALTKDGWVVTRDSGGKPIVLSDKDNSNLKADMLTAEMIFTAKSAKGNTLYPPKVLVFFINSNNPNNPNNPLITLGDYHANMDSDTYIAWIRHRALPTLRVTHPGKRVYFYLDNARYHKRKRGHPSISKEWVGISSMSKPQLAALLTLWEVNEIIVHRVDKSSIDNPVTGISTLKTLTFTSAQYTDRAPGGPSAAELRKVAEAHKDRHPEFFETIAEAVLKEESLKDSNNSNPNFHRFVYTPPNEGFAVQATEEGWGIAKNYVALSPEAHNKVADLKRLVREGLYGVDEYRNVRGTMRHISHPGADGAKLIRRCEANENMWIKEHSKCYGTIDKFHAVGLYDEEKLRKQWIIRLNEYETSSDESGSDSDQNETSSDQDEISATEDSDDPDNPDNPGNLDNPDNPDNPDNSEQADVDMEAVSSEQRVDPTGS